MRDCLSLKPEVEARLSRIEQAIEDQKAFVHRAPDPNTREKLVASNPVSQDASRYKWLREERRRRHRRLPLVIMSTAQPRLLRTPPRMFRRMFFGHVIFAQPVLKNFLVLVEDLQHLGGIKRSFERWVYNVGALAFVTIGMVALMAVYHFAVCRRRENLSFFENQALQSSSYVVRGTPKVGLCKFRQNRNQAVISLLDTGERELSIFKLNPNQRMISGRTRIA